jgi:hypothetical protein
VYPLEVLRTRFALLSRRLDWVEAALGPADAARRDWARQEFANAIADRRCDLKQESSGASADTVAWQVWTTQEQKCEPLFREALAWLQAQNRPALDAEGPAVLARALVSELSEACGLDIVPVIAADVQDSFTDFVQIIRLRFPSADVWDVPVIAHEFGHFAAYRLTAPPQDGPARAQKVHEFVRERLAGRPSFEHAGLTYRANELFADVFATYALGPAFGLSALLLRFKVAEAYNDSDAKHPSYAARAVVVLETMERLSQEDQALGRVYEWLSVRWQQLLRSALSPTDLIGIKDIAADLLDIVREIARNARYGGWLTAGDRLQAAFFAPDLAPNYAFTSRDLLNAAWLAHTNGADLERVSTRALQLWQQRRNA